jgi:hypothetical protein
LLGHPTFKSIGGFGTFPIIVGAWLMGCLLAIVVSTPYLGDDLVNKGIRDIVAASGRSLTRFTVELTTAWMTNQGRFFPGALSWTYSVFWLFDTRVAYKLVIGMTVLGAIAVVGLLAARLTQRWKAAALFVPIALGLMQLRTTHDGLTSYAGLLPLTTGLSVAALVIVISRRGAGWAALAFVSYSLALVTYETVLLFAPIMVAIVVWIRRSWRPALAIAIPALIQTGIVIVLRLNMKGEQAPAYTVNLEPQVVLLTFAKQVLAAFPLSQWILSASSMPAISAGSIVAGALVAGIPTFVLFVYLGRSRFRAGRGQIVVLAAFGAWLWLSSSALIAITVRWQIELHRGQGYLSVVYGYFGLALCLLAAFLAVDRFMTGKQSRAVATWRVGSALLIGALVTLTFAGNLTVASIA